jgi:acyl-CoA reductase-like NAD-dependent aldehyde dehydrogenase
MASPKFPEPPSPVPPTPTDVADSALRRLAANKDAWVRVGIPERIGYLRQISERIVVGSEAWVRDACRAKGLDPDAPHAGEEWLGGPMTTLRNVRMLIETLEAGGQPSIPSVRTRGDQQIATVFPANLKDRLMFTGFVGEVWLEPGKAPTQGRIYRDKAEGRHGAGKVSLVLGAGNVASIGPMDAFYKLFVEDEVVILKTNPVNAYLGPHLERVMQPLIEAGFFAIVHGGAEIGQFLTHHELVESIHMTGSDRTHDAIVWGGDPDEQARRKAANEPKITKPITSELGCVTPVIVVPGEWSESDLDFQARHVAGMVANNGSFNCNAAKVLVTAAGWPQEKAFLAKVRAALAGTPVRKAYYPGAKDRYRKFLENYPEADRTSEERDDVVPWTVLPSVPARAGEYALTNEAFCGVLAQVSLDAADPVDFLRKVVPFANDEVWGTLSCVLLIHPSVEKAHPTEVDGAIADLRYGGIGVNVWAGVVYGLVATTWGAFPGHTLQDVRSGIGVVHNSYLLDHPQKSVVKAPFRIMPTPAWFADHRNQASLGRALTQFEASPGWLSLPSVILQAIRG